MADLLTLPRVADAARVRLAQLSQALLDAQQRQSHPQRVRLVESILNLRFAVETAAQLPDGSADQQATLSYAVETYGLAATYTDPILRANLPDVPATGAKVRFRVRSINGRILTYNGRAVSAGAVLTS